MEDKENSLDEYLDVVTPKAEVTIDLEDTPSIEMSFESVNAAVTVTPVVKEVLDWDFAPPSEETQLLIQEALADRGFYIGKKNGNWGPLSIEAIRQAVAVLGRHDKPRPKDLRAADRDLCELVHEYATLFGGYSLSITSSTTILNEDVWLAFLVGLESEDK